MVLPRNKNVTYIVLCQSSGKCLDVLKLETWCKSLRAAVHWMVLDDVPYSSLRTGSLNLWWDFDYSSI